MDVVKIARSNFLPIVVVVLGALLFYLIYDQKNKQIAVFEHYRLASLAEVYKSSLLSHKDVTDAIFNLVVNQDDVLATYAKAYESPEKNGSIRVALAQKLSPAYKALKSNGLKQLHFHTTTGHSFLRFHKPESFGDPLADVRPSIRIANFDQKYVTGFEEGRVYNGFRYVHPLFYHGKHIGSVETSISAKEMLEHLKSIDHGEFQLYLDKKISDETVWKEDAEAFYKQTALSPDFLVEKSCVASEIIKKINQQISFEAAVKMKTYVRFVLSAKIDGRNYVAIFIPITSVGGGHSAYLARYMDDDTMWLIARDFQMKIVALSIVIFILLLAGMALRREIIKRERVQEDLKRLNETLAEEVQRQVDELKEKDKALFRQSKHAAMGEMIGAIAHQWRQPLNVLGLAIQEVKLAYSFGEVDEKFVDNFIAQSMVQIQHMSQTIEDFRGFFSVDKEIEVVSIKKSILEAYALASKQFQSHGIEIDVGGDNFNSLGRSGDFKQVILNLLNNSKDQILLMQETGKEVDKNIVITLEKFEDYGKVSIEDSAGGIKEENISKIFDSYFTTKNDAGGTGIGLYMSKLIITDMFHGEMSVRNGQRGAIFEIILPLSEQSIL